ncbi:MAG: hypothetical protein U1E52_18030 [Geminicoccaceae bacterium]
MLDHNPDPLWTGLAARLPGTAQSLSLAAAPTFAVMALFASNADHDSMGMICASGQAWSSVDGMSAMYLLMSAFHLPAWLRLVVGERNSLPGNALESRHTCHSHSAPHDPNLPSTTIERKPT